jgi:isoleucyl-tRNA synthetase
MSKSAGNVVRPQEINDTQGADILRLWVAMSDSTGDLRIGDQVLAGMSDAYRRFRNTFRFVLGNLAGFTDAEQIDASDMPDLERWVLHRLHELERVRADAFAAYDFQAFYRALHNFCANDLSSFYFDVRKDSLYCDRSDSVRRRAARSTLLLLHDILTAWLAPVLCFTAEEAWLERRPGESESVHLRTFPEIPETWRNDALARSFTRMRRVRNLITSALEIMRREHTIGSSLEAQACVHGDTDLLADIASHDLAELAIASRITLSEEPAPPDAYRDPTVPGIAVHATAADGTKCARCWRVLPEVEEKPDELCSRCREAV